MVLAPQKPLKPSFSIYVLSQRGFTREELSNDCIGTYSLAKNRSACSLSARFFQPCTIIRTSSSRITGLYAYSPNRSCTLPRYCSPIGRSNFTMRRSVPSSSFPPFSLEAFAHVNGRAPRPHKPCRCHSTPTMYMQNSFIPSSQIRPAPQAASSVSKCSYYSVAQLLGGASTVVSNKLDIS